MVFSSLSFLYFFFPAVVILYYLCKNRVYRNTVLLIASLLFYAWGEPKFIVVMILSVICAYIGGLLIDKLGKLQKYTAKKATMTVTVVVLVGVLFVFKYLNLFADTVNAIIPGMLSFKKIILPIGISFYTFQILSYVIDVYRGTVKLQTNFFYLLLYVCFFPQLIAGPIVRYETIELEIRNRNENWVEFVGGLERFIFGLAKKVILSNNLAKIVDGIYGVGIEESGTVLAWIAVLAYTLQIYFDFSGYSDMAIGIGRMFGFHFLENFNYPYMANSVTDFWRRWHISLSTWFKDYIYIPLGGNRVGKLRHIFNLLAVWALTGFWHGAQWSFLLWGLYYGVILIFEKFVLAKILDKLPQIFRWIYTFLLVIIGWVIFYNESLADIFTTLKVLFVYSSGPISQILASNAVIIPALAAIPIGLVCSFPIFKKLFNGDGACITIVREAVCFILLVLCIIFLLSSSYNPFIYFRF